MLNQPTPAIERRQFPRRRTFLGAQVVFRGGNCSIGCKILGISRTGATVEPWNTLWCPREFHLIARFEAPRRCEVVWRKGSLLGVRYSDLPHLQPPLINAHRERNADRGQNNPTLLRTRAGTFRKLAGQTADPKLIELYQETADAFEVQADAIEAQAAIQ